MLKLNQTNNDKLNNTTVSSLQAKETTGNIDELVYKKSLGDKYNDYDGIAKVSDFSELISTKYRWRVQIEKVDPEDELTNLYTYTYAEFHIKDLENDRKLQLRMIPKSLYIDWKNDKKYSVVYNFNALEILKAFRKLSLINSPYPITIKFVIDKSNFTRCEISRGDTVVELQDLFPDKP